LSSRESHPAAPGPLEQRATRIAFFVAGFGLAAWAPLVPYAKARAGLDDGTLGLLLLALGIGSIAAMPAAGALAARFGCRLVLILSSAMVALALPLLATLSSLPGLAAALLLFGAGMGAVDCGANIQAIMVERAAGRPMMSGFHGLFSLGGITGSAGVSGLLSLGVSPPVAALAVMLLVALAMAVAAPRLLPYGGERGGPAFALPHGVVLAIGLLCFILFLTEGAVLDWSAVFLIATRGVEPSHAGLAYAAFSLTMTAGRLAGDRIVRRVGGPSVILAGGLCAALGIAVATLYPDWPVMLAGYALIGAGCSNIVPVLYTAVGRQRAMPESIAVPAVTTLGYAGILAGPAAIGFIAQIFSLAAAFLMLAALLLGVAASARLLRL
jgi:predicted MFS family arabinose efflux permease